MGDRVEEIDLAVGRPADPLQTEAWANGAPYALLIHIERCSLPQAAGHSGLTAGPLETLYR